MKRIIASLLGTILLASALYAADPIERVYYTSVGSQAIQTDHSGTWVLLDSSIVYTATDSANIVTTVTGLAKLADGETVYLGINVDGTAPLVSDSNSVTIQVSGGQNYEGYAYIPFTLRLVQELRSQTDLLDTVYINAASQDARSAVELTDVEVTVAIYNHDAT